ncbi:MAG: aspartyl/asparaginyl beta-hydroxylase domain-containing protein, partial [Parvularculaceae bacterium]
LFGALYLVLQSLSEPIELVWSLNAKNRLKAWVFPMLLAGAAIALAGAILTAAGSSLHRMGAIAPIAIPHMVAAAYVIPLAALAVFSAAALKRYLTMRRGVFDMKAMTGVSSRTISDGLERIRMSIATEAGGGSTNVRPNPQGFFVAGLTSRPWHDPKTLPWIAGFTAAVDDIRREALYVLDAHHDAITVYKYPGLDGDQWKAFKLATRHQEIPENLARAPVTARLLKTIPGYPSFRDAMFSILEPGGEIKPHRDVSNVFLTMHLGLATPEDGGFLEVAGERRPWRAGEALVFDSSYEHRAVNPSSEPRIVLLVDFLHPEMTERERAWAASARL